MAKVEVRNNTQAVHDGTVYDAGETAELPDDVAAQWVREGWASEVKAAVKGARK